VTPTNLFYYVKNGAITDPPPKQIFSSGFEQARNPFKLPSAIGSIRVRGQVMDEDLSGFGVYRLWVEERGDPPAPEYIPVTGELVIDAEGKRVTRTDSWREPDSTERLAYNRAMWAQQAQSRKDREAQSALAEPDSDSPAVLRRKLSAALHLLDTVLNNGH
jgi:hypothetical protein